MWKYASMISSSLVYISEVSDRAAAAIAANCYTLAPPPLSTPALPPCTSPLHHHLHQHSYSPSLLAACRFLSPLPCSRMSLLFFLFFPSYASVTSPLFSMFWRHVQLSIVADLTCGKNSAVKQTSLLSSQWLWRSRFEIKLGVYTPRTNNSTVSLSSREQNSTRTKIVDLYYFALLYWAAQELPCPSLY